jgi:hypothetical protein
MLPDLMQISISCFSVSLILQPPFYGPLAAAVESAATMLKERNAVQTLVPFCVLSQSAYLQTRTHISC